MPYHANVGPVKGPVKYREIPSRSIDVLDAPDNHMPIGRAYCLTSDENGLAEWQILIRRQPIEGRWAIIDREFRPA